MKERSKRSPFLLLGGGGAAWHGVVWRGVARCDCIAVINLITRVTSYPRRSINRIDIARWRSRRASTRCLRTGHVGASARASYRRYVTLSRTSEGNASSRWRREHRLAAVNHRHQRGSNRPLHSPDTAATVASVARRRDIAQRIIFFARTCHNDPRLFTGRSGTFLFSQPEKLALSELFGLPA